MGVSHKPLALLVVAMHGMATHAALLAEGVEEEHVVGAYPLARLEELGQLLLRIKYLVARGKGGVHVVADAMGRPDIKGPQQLLVRGEGPFEVSRQGMYTPLRLAGSSQGQRIDTGIGIEGESGRRQGVVGGMKQPDSPLRDKGHPAPAEECRGEGKCNEQIKYALSVAIHLMYLT